MAIKWNDHSKLEGLHAFLGASQWHWINWNDEIFEKRFASQYSTTLGTAIHELASQCIKSRTKLTMEEYIFFFFCVFCSLSQNLTTLGMKAKNKVSGPNKKHACK